MKTQRERIEEIKALAGNDIAIVANVQLGVTGGALYVDTMERCEGVCIVNSSIIENPKSFPQRIIRMVVDENPESATS